MDQAGSWNPEYLSPHEGLPDSPQMQFHSRQQCFVLKSPALESGLVFNPSSTSYCWLNNLGVGPNFESFCELIRKAVSQHLAHGTPSIYVSFYYYYWDLKYHLTKCKYPERHTLLPVKTWRAGEASLATPMSIRMAVASQGIQDWNLGEAGN